MRIDGTQPITAALLNAALGKRTPFEADKDAQAAAEPNARGANAVAAMPTTSVEMLVALAAAETPADRRRRIAASTERGVTLLERLRDELAAGEPSVERLHDLAAWAETFSAPDEPQLAELARDIELRVRVELAKLDMRA